MSFVPKVENLNSYWDYPTITNPYSAAPNFSCTEFNKTLDYALLVLILSFIMHYTKIISIMLPTIFPAAFVTDNSYNAHKIKLPKSSHHSITQ